ncbi:MAG TPA: hypothetical protein VK056_01975 [Bacillota bacterium]|nr:hypothetical protein [Bacillota bacterium]
MSKQMDQQNKKTNPILWFLFAIVIPMVVMLVLIYTVLLLAGVDVNSWLKNTGKKVPVISAMITTDEEKSYQELEEKFNELKDEHDTTTNSYLTEIESYKSTIEQLENEIDKLEAQLEFAKDNSEEETSLTASDEEMIKKLSASFKTMKPKQAALIFSDLDKNIAVELLNTVSNDVRGKILEAMEPKLAAELTELMIDQQ